MSTAFRRTARLAATAESFAPAAPRLNFGIAIAAIKAIITTTNIISNNVKPVYLRFDISVPPEGYLLPVDGVRHRPTRLIDWIMGALKLVGEIFPSPLPLPRRTVL